MTADPTLHIPVMSQEVLAALDPQLGQILVDATAGGGGHLRRLAVSVGPQGHVLGIDHDPKAVERLQQEFTDGPVDIVWGNYADLPEILEDRQLPQVSGILLDLGLSSDQLADASRGFSFHIDGPLDLRFNPHSGEPAWRLLQRLSAEHLADLIYRYGEERHSRRVARAIVEARRTAPLRTAQEVADVIRRAIRSRYRDRIDPATRTFQALRIAVNHELENLQTALRRMPDCLAPGGRLAVISFHSLEDRLVKMAFREDPRWRASQANPYDQLTSKSGKTHVAAAPSCEWPSGSPNPYTSTVNAPHGGGLPMSYSQPIRTLSLAAILIIAAVAVRNHFEQDLPTPPLMDDLPPAVIHVARDDTPTIVESNEDWLDAPASDEALEAASPSVHPDVLPLPRSPSTREPHPRGPIIR